MSNVWYTLSRVGMKRIKKGTERGVYDIYKASEDKFMTRHASYKVFKKVLSEIRLYCRRYYHYR